MEHVCEGLKPGCSYQTRVYCMSEGGQSPVSHSASAHVGTQSHTWYFTGIQRVCRSVTISFDCWLEERAKFHLFYEIQVERTAVKISNCTAPS